MEDRGIARRPERGQKRLKVDGFIFVGLGSRRTRLEGSAALSESAARRALTLLASRSL